MFLENLFNNSCDDDFIFKSENNKKHHNFNHNHKNKNATKANNLQKKSKCLTGTGIEDIFLSNLALLVCAGQMDINKNFDTYLTNQMINEYLKSGDVDINIINYILETNKLEGNVIYLRNNVDSECMCLETKNKFYLIFYGTQFQFNDLTSLVKDLYTDICLGVEPIKFIKSTKPKIHSKYQENMYNDKMIKNIYNIILKKKIKSVCICGHSMGAGLATFTSLYLLNKIPQINIELFNFDAPKIGNVELRNYLYKKKNIKHFNIIHSKDVIPFYPFIYPNYTEISKDIYFIDKDTKQITLEKDLERNILTNFSVKDHYCNNIMKTLFNIIHNQQI